MHFHARIGRRYAAPVVVSVVMAPLLRGHRENESPKLSLNLETRDVDVHWCNHRYRLYCARLGRNCYRQKRVLNERCQKMFDSSRLSGLQLCCDAAPFDRVASALDDQEF